MDLTRVSEFRVIVPWFENKREKEMEGWWRRRSDEKTVMLVAAGYGGGREAKRGGESFFLCAKYCEWKRNPDMHIYTRTLVGLNMGLYN